MANILEYLDWRGDLTLLERPFNEVDNLILAEICYLDFSGFVPAGFQTQQVTLLDAASAYFAAHPETNMGVLVPDQIPVLVEHAAKTARFSDVRLLGYVNRIDEETQTQFSALTMLLPDGSAYVAFRGTDDTIVGWKEDFNMAFRYPVPAQHAACEYVCAVARLWRGPMVLLGHSKGGNLAVYAAMNASDEVKDRVERIYSLDGPGFPEAVVNSFEYSSVSDRIVKIVPDSSVVGMVLETPERCMVVKSDVEGIMQHFACSWQMHGGEFDKVEDVANSSVTFNKALNKWLSNLSKEQRERAVDALFAVLEASGAGSISAMMAAGPKVIPEMLGTYVGLSIEDRRNLNQALGIMLQAALARNPKVRRR